MKYIARQIGIQAQAEAPRLLLATLSLLIVGLMINPKDMRSEDALAETKIEEIKIEKGLKDAKRSLAQSKTARAR